MKMNYVELAKAKVQSTRNIVISKASKGGFTMANQIVVPEGNRETEIYMKGAFIIEDVEGLKSLRDALNVAIHKIEEAESEDWD